jgi:hypothetical protein
VGWVGVVLLLVSRRVLGGVSTVKLGIEDLKMLEVGFKWSVKIEQTSLLRCLDSSEVLGL